MRRLALLVILPSLWPVAGVAGQTGAATANIALPASPSQSRVCVQVSIAGQTAPDYDCLNQQLDGQARGAQHVSNIPPEDANAPAVRVGGFNQAALSQQYGKNWGNSPTVYRPPAQNYSNPLTGH